MVKTKERKASGTKLDKTEDKEKKLKKIAEKNKEIEYDKDDEKGINEDELEKEIGFIEKEHGDKEHNDFDIKSSKPISQIKKGDKIKVDGIELEVDAHYVLIDHGATKEMTIELFDPKTDKDYQLRYFSDQIETSLEFYELEEIIYNKKPFSKIEW